jgi:hypothetical protein
MRNYIRLIFQSYIRQNINSEQSILAPLISSIDPTYTHFVSETVIRYFPIDESESLEERSKGRMIFTNSDGSICLGVYEIVVSFPVSGDDLESVLDHLLEMFSHSATKCEIVKSKYLSTNPL